MKKIIPAISLILILMFLVGCGGRPSRRQDEVTRTVPVIVEEVMPRTLNEYIQLTGKLEGWTDIVMASETSGKILELKKQLVLVR